MRIALTGTPGTGKTKLSKKLAKKLGYELIDLNKLIKKEKVYDDYDRKRKSYIVDIKKLNKFVRKIIKDNVIIDSHLSHYLPQRLIDVVIVLRCKPEVLKKRLKNKKWNKEKIRENYEAELIGLISYEAKQLHKKVYEIDTTNKGIDNIIKEIVKNL
ncbi:MAG: adenylate kinase family protein [Candidatus Aenigmatarchaeota archaeon]